MRKGTKRKAREVVGKAKSKEETQSVNNKEENGGEGTKGVVKGRAKPAKIAKPETETEYFPDKRNLEDLWQEVFPVGTEWDQIDMVYQYKWNFSNLEDAFEEGGELHGKKVYLFGCTEPQLVFFQGQSKVTCIPVVVAVVSPFPPSDKIGINSVQREAEEILPMKQMKMDWVPYIPLEKREAQVERLKSQIFILRCTQRRAGLKHLKLERVKKFEYCLPYFYQPFAEDEFEQSTIVQILFPTEPPVFCEFDWEFDEPEEMADKLIEGEELSADQKDEFMEFVKEKVKEGKKSNREAREARKKAIQEMSEEAKAAFQSMKFYKFYPVPSPDAPDVSQVKSPFINRYYGKAHKVF
ncbi:protein HEAT INTOLERANT 4-like [Lycium barbarum]|uniref:protein HEAT INTOLERANT 4-like n=1 Tax=Lycium barbarum TaxID=112863 RepID=UPI00293E76B3|nr:protein HEAT INTOLERANT 4-like [Lycium barbarum]